MKLIRIATYSSFALALLVNQNLQAQESKPASINGQEGYVVCAKKFKKDNKDIYRRMRVAIDCPKGWTEVQSQSSINGEDGAKGEKGDKGDKGEQGLQGIQGVKGEKGDKGDKGDTGATGQQGVAGAQGVKGDTGAFSPLGCQKITSKQEFSYIDSTLLPYNSATNTLSLNCNTDLSSKKTMMMVNSGFHIYSEAVGSSVQFFEKPGFGSQQNISQNQSSYVKAYDSNGKIVVIPVGITVTTEVNRDGLKDMISTMQATDAKAVIELDAYCCPI